MLKRWAAWPPGIRWLVSIAAVVLGLAIVWTLFEPLADWLAHHDVGSATGPLHETALDNARGRLLTMGAGLVAAAALVFTALNFSLLRRNSEQADQWQRRTHELTEQGQVTDRYTKAIEQLGSDKLDVRIGGIYALERIARDSARDHTTVIDVLSAFVREHSREPWSPPARAGQAPGRRTRPDVQAALAVLCHRDEERDVLPGIDLRGADLPRSFITGPGKVGARLSGSDLASVILADADMFRADLRNAILVHADLTGAILIGANLGGALLAHADLTRTNLTGAILTEADLADSTNLTGAILSGADLTGADLAGVNLTGADLTNAIWPNGVPVPDGWTADSGSGRLKRAGQLSEVTDHYL